MDDVEPRPSKPHSLADAGGFAVLGLVMVGFILPYRLWLALAPGGPPPAHFELEMMLLSALIALALPLLQIVLQIRRFGGTAVRSNREDFPQDDGMGGRVERAQLNLTQSLVPFAAAAIAVDVLNAGDRGTAAASALYLAARAVHATAYTLGITILRSAAYYAGVVATVILILHLVFRTPA